MRLALCLAFLCAVALPARATDAPRFVDDDTAVVRVLDTIAERLSLMPQIAAAKWHSGAAVSDPAREQAVLETSATKAAGIGLAPEPARGFFALQIRLAREAQQRLHDTWRSSGCDICTGREDMAALRARLDALGTAQLRAIYLAAPALAEPDFATRRAALATDRLAAVLPEADERSAVLAALAAIRRSAAPSLARVRASGLLRIGTTGDYAPFSLEIDGRLAGADIVLAQSLARELRVEPVFVPTHWPTLMQDLAADRFDVGLSGITITPERAAQAAFSIAYYRGGKTIVARCSERARFAAPAALDAPDVRVVVNPGGTNEAWVRANLRRAQIIVHPENRTIFDEILAGRADAMVTDDVEAELQSRLHPGLCRTMRGTLTRADKAVLMARDAALKDAVDAWLRAQLAAGVPARLLTDQKR